MAFGVRLERVAARMHGLVEADRGQRIVQRLARTHVHVRTADGDERQRRDFAQRLHAVAIRLVVHAMRALERDPGARGKVSRTHSASAVSTLSFASRAGIHSARQSFMPAR